MSVKMRFPVHRGNIKCPNCKISIIFNHDILNNEEIKCLRCDNIFSYDDGLIEFLSSTRISVLFLNPICAGVVDLGKIKTKVGNATKVQFKTPFHEIYDVNIGKPVKLDEISEQIILSPVKVTTKGFVLASSSYNRSLVNKDIEISYFARGRDFLENVPIWHRFLQSTINSIKTQQYSMAIVESIIAFDAYFDEFLMTQLEKKRGYSLKCVKRMVETYNRRDKLFYLLFYVTGKSFEDSQFNTKLRKIVTLRNKIVHPKGDKFRESDLTEGNASEALKTVIKSIKWVNDTKGPTK